VARDLLAVLLSAAKPEEALAVARALKDRKPPAAIGHAMEGDVHAWRKNWHDAERSYRTALKVESQSTDNAISLCRVMSASGRKSESARFAKDWIARNPADVAMRMHVADTVLSAKDYKGAVMQYEAVLGQAPNHVLALNN